MNYYKIIGNNFGHFPYHIGINSLAETDEIFDSRPICESGGLYFTTLKYILAYLNYGDRLCRIQIPGDAHVVHVGTKRKADKIEIVDIQPLDVGWLIAQGADVHAGDDFAFHWSVQHEQIATMECLIIHGANLHANNDFALRWSAAQGHTAVVECLLKHGADVHVRQEMVLYESACKGHLAVIECLLAHGADVHANDGAALCWSAYNGHLAVVECLLAHGADVHANDDAALRWSVERGHLTVVKCLLAHGADVYGHTAVVECLRKINV